MKEYRKGYIKESDFLNVIERTLRIQNNEDFDKLLLRISFYNEQNGFKEIILKTI